MTGEFFAQMTQEGEEENAGNYQTPRGREKISTLTYGEKLEIKDFGH